MASAIDSKNQKNLDELFSDLFIADVEWKKSMKEKLLEAIKKAPLPIQDHINQLENKVKVLENLKMISYCHNKELTEENNHYKKQLSILQKRVDYLEAKENGNENVVKKKIEQEHDTESTKDVDKRKINYDLNEKKQNDVRARKKIYRKNIAKPEEIINHSLKHKESTTGEHSESHKKENDISFTKTESVNRILLKEVNKEALNTDLKKLIVDIGRKIRIKINPNDIDKVEQLQQKYFERQKITPNTIILVVQFVSHSMKLRFLKSKELLKQSSFTKNFDIVDYVSEETYDLYQYAKYLKVCGFAAVYWRNDNVYVKRNLSQNCKEICIRSLADVDELINTSNSKNGEEDLESTSSDDSDNVESTSSKDSDNSNTSVKNTIINN